METSLRKLIRELAQEELEEVSSSGATPGYQSPHAFRGDGEAGIRKARKNASQAGYSIVGKLSENKNV